MFIFFHCCLELRGLNKAKAHLSLVLVFSDSFYHNAQNWHNNHIWVGFLRMGILHVSCHFKKMLDCCRQNWFATSLSQLLWAEYALFSTIPHQQTYTNSLHCPALNHMQILQFKSNCFFQSETKQAKFIFWWNLPICCHTHL